MFPRPSGQLPYEFDFFRPVGSAIRVEDLVKPDRWLTIRIRFCQESQGRLVCVLPATKPQLIAATLYFFATGKVPWKQLLFPRAMYSVQRIGRS